MIKQKNWFDPDKYIGKKFGCVTVTGWFMKKIPSGEARRMTCICECGATRVFSPERLDKCANTYCKCNKIPVQSSPWKEVSHTKQQWLKVTNKNSLYEESWSNFDNFLRDVGIITPGIRIDKKNRIEPWSKYNFSFRPMARSLTIPDRVKAGEVTIIKGQHVPYKTPRR